MDALEEVIWEVVVEHLGDWGTTAKIDQWGTEKNKPIRELMNSLVGPLIDDLYQKISTHLKEKENERS